MKPPRRDVDPLPPGTVMPPLNNSAITPGLLATDKAHGGLLTVQDRPAPAQANKPNRLSSRAPRASRTSTDRFRSINEFVDSTMRTLSDRAAKAWLVLWRDTKPNGVARTAISDLARRMGCSPATAKRALAELKQLRILEVESRGGLGRGPSSYRLPR